MIRIAYALCALAVSLGTLSGFGPICGHRESHAPAIIGEDHPVFLGRMVVTATPLPDDSAR